MINAIKIISHKRTFSWKMYILLYDEVQQYKPAEHYEELQ